MHCPVVSGVQIDPKEKTANARCSLAHGFRQKLRLLGLFPLLRTTPCYNRSRRPLTMGCAPDLNPDPWSTTTISAERCRMLCLWSSSKSFPQPCSGTSLLLVYLSSALDTQSCPSSFSLSTALAAHMRRTLEVCLPHHHYQCQSALSAC